MSRGCAPNRTGKVSAKIEVNRMNSNGKNHIGWSLRVKIWRKTAGSAGLGRLDLEDGDSSNFAVWRAGGPVLLQEQHDCTTWICPKAGWARQIESAQMASAWIELDAIEWKPMDSNRASCSFCRFRFMMFSLKRWWNTNGFITCSFKHGATPLVLLCFRSKI